MVQSSRLPETTRRQFLQRSGAAAVSAAILSQAIPKVHAAENNTIRLALVGCGNRGNGAVVNALNTSDQGPIELFAMADLDERKVEASLKPISRDFPHGVNVAKDRVFIGFEAYKAAIDVLRPGDIAMCTTRAYIRPVHVEYAVQKGIHVFMEKPFAPDPVGLQRLLKAGELAEQKGVKIAAGLQCRHSPARAALIDKIGSGEMGELCYIRANRLADGSSMPNYGDKTNNFLEQLQFGRTHLLWVGSGHMVDYLIHQIDECCWLMNDWPVSCHGMGGRQVNREDRGQNMDVYSMEYTFPSGKKAFCGFRRTSEGELDFATFVHCSKKAGQFSGQTHAPTVRMYKDHRIAEDNIQWKPTDDAKSPWDYEWIDFIHSIRNDKPHNEAKRAVYADFATLMGRAAVHLNRTVTWEEVTQSKFQFCDYLDELTEQSEPPVKADENGFFPAPEPGKWVEL
jgi:predicted dehydrogenase